MNKNILNDIHNHILKVATIERAENNKWFFKTGAGQYGEGDKFIGLSVPETRKIAKVWQDISLKEADKLLKSEFHEERLLALFILISKFKKGDRKLREEIFNLYFKNIKYINNWDLVDTSARDIAGEFVKEKYSLKSKNCSGIKFLVSLASDKNIFAKNKKEKLWEKRIAIVSTFAFMLKPLKNEYAPAIIFEVVKKILNEKDELNKHDLIQKASGWMLREYGKRVSEEKMIKFLEENFDNIKKKRTLLRYTIERLPKEKINYWLKKI